jgi:hypothetical protein
MTWGRRLVGDGPEPIARTSTDNTPSTPEVTYQGSSDPTLSNNRITNGSRAYRSFIVYSKEEDAARAMHLRKDAAKDLPVPLVTQLRERREQGSLARVDA